MNYYPYPYPHGGGPYFSEPSLRMQANPNFPPMGEPPSGAVITPSTPTGPPGFSPPNGGMNDAIANYLSFHSGRLGGSYIDNILRLNRGKMARVHMTFNSGGPSSETRVFTGKIETAARDHIILSEPSTGKRFILLMVYLDFIEFPDEINYYYPGTNVLNIVDDSVLKENPEIMPLFNFQQAQRARFIQQLEAANAQNPKG